jgi:hypothetical protein
MRIVRHPNIVELKAFFYNNGERVCVCKQARPCIFVYLTVSATEGRGLPESRTRIRSRDRLPCLALLQQDEDRHAHSRGQALHLPALPLPRLHPLPRHLPQGHQAAKSPLGSIDRCTKAV